MTTTPSNPNPNLNPNNMPLKGTRKAHPDGYTGADESKAYRKQVSDLYRHMADYVDDTPLIDPIHNEVDIFEVDLIKDVWRDKYAYKNETNMNHTLSRVAAGIMGQDFHQMEEAVYKIMKAGLFMPGGRILAGAGTSKRVTYMNCYVADTIEDSMEGIHKILGQVMFTLQQGGGIGTDFSTLRPRGALLRRTGEGSEASGPLPFMDTWNATSLTIKSAGDRRGAMMGTISDTHPDLPEFITAKHTKGRLEQFNMSVLVSDAFLQAVQDDVEWPLYFAVPPAHQRDQALEDRDFEDANGVQQYVYSVWKAKELWDMITRSTYEYSEPGVIFVDRINERNNLYYCEDIRCTNPCVTGDTLILTDLGYLPIEDLVGQKVNIWNGFEWSAVEPFSTGVNGIMELTFSNGSKVKCTDYHKWLSARGDLLEAKYLKAGDALATCEFPIVTEGISYTGDGYSQGFYAGDGSVNAEYSSVYSPKYDVIPYLRGSVSDQEYCGRGTRVRWHHGKMLPKEFVPVNGESSYCIGWLSGLLDADGSLSYPQGKSHPTAMPVVQLTSKDPEFLENVRLMLTRLGVSARVRNRKDGGTKSVSGVEGTFQNTYVLTLAAKACWTLHQQGLQTHRLDLSWVREPAGKANAPLRIESIELLGKEETFCFNEPLRNMGVFNGVWGHNCGEQPLPPNGTCNLGAINLSRVVRKPFTSNAYIDWDVLQVVVWLAVRFLDNVIDETAYPLPEQEQEEKSKRRLGLGISGLADMLAMLGVAYGNNKKCIALVGQVMQYICYQAYWASTHLARECGVFPAYDPEKFLQGAFVKELPADIRKDIATYGIRNGLLLTIAPTGTTSLVFGNISSGLEPVFLHEMSRKVFGKDNQFKEYGVVPAYGYRLYQAVNGKTAVKDLPDYMVTTADLNVGDHLVVQAVCQEHIDASVSKTINLPEDITFEDFQEVYMDAYNLGCKGCTTYRPSDVRGSILSAPKSDSEDKIESTPSSEAAAVSQPTSKALAGRPERLAGYTYKVKWPSWSSSLFVTVNHDYEGHPIEVFLASKDARHQEWITALTIMISALLRQGAAPSFIVQELAQVQSTYDSAWIKGKHYGSVIAFLADVLAKHWEPKASPRDGEVVDKWIDQITEDNYEQLPLDDSTNDPQHPANPVNPANPANPLGMVVCESCGEVAMIREEGCWNCISCGYSKCG